MSYHLTDGETFRIIDSLFVSLMGARNFARWRVLKRKMNFRSEVSFMAWVLDSLDTIYQVDQRGEEDRFNNATVAAADGDGVLVDGVSNIVSIEEDNEGVVTILREPSGGPPYGGENDEDDDGDYRPSDVKRSKAGAGTVTTPGGDVIKRRAPRGSTSWDGRRHQCPVCHKLYYNPQNLARHRHLHTGVKPYKCPHCDMRFAQKIGIRSHVEHKHMGGHTPFECQVCHKKFKSRAVLRTHERKHPLKMFSCSLCEARFNTFKQVQRHFKVAHNISEEVTGRAPADSIFCCSICNAMFEDMLHFEKHKCKSGAASGVHGAAGGVHGAAGGVHGAAMGVVKHEEEVVIDDTLAHHHHTTVAMDTGAAHHHHQLGAQLGAQPHQLGVEPHQLGADIVIQQLPGGQVITSQGMIIETLSDSLVMHPQQ